MPICKDLQTQKNKVAEVLCSVRRIVLHLAGGYPLKDLFARILGRLSELSVKSIAFG